ncbi:HU family DNA-binding protein [Falsirhodobacter halotolerans]|uniref:HU family DNA-binding protein n=1 Tax=Falsirhodobacter halotolerans TaxID=1146892 RepID=UPI001FD31739|nr:HU family DNA-binding protein [Falsirhodobacter halotolerans]MCJ8139403.1 HU family DNA-binding protein [Falsirhodobacter halotolerans]
MATPRKTPAKPAPETPTVAATKFPELIDVVVERTGQKRAVVKPVLEAFLAAMKEKLVEGSDLTLPPMGKLKMVKRKEDDGPMTLKLRPQNASKTAKSGLADDED